MKPFVSILMPVFNGEAHLNEAIDSILKQTFSDFELISVDDASSDGSLPILERYAKDDRRIKIIRNSENVGLTKSLIKAIDLAEGRYLARQDADDISLPGRLEKQIAFLERNKAYGAVGTSASVIDENGNIFKKAWVPKSWSSIQQILKFGNCFLHGSMMIRRDDYNSSGGYRSAFSVGQDYDLWLRLSKIKKLKNLCDCLYLWRSRSDSLTSMKTDSQFKVGALALYDYRFDKKLQLDNDFEINQFIGSLNGEERVRYDSCLRDLILRHGNFQMAGEYMNSGIINICLLNLAKIAFKVIRFKRHQI